MALRQRAHLRVRGATPLADAWGDYGYVAGAYVRPLEVTAGFTELFVKQGLDQYLDGAGRTVTIQLRPSGGGAALDALPPWKISGTLADDGFYLPLLDLQPDTSYDVRTIVDGQAVRGATVRTRALPSDPATLVPTHWVGAGGSDAAAGTSYAARWLTLNKAVAAANAATADMVIGVVAPGYYAAATTKLVGNGHAITLVAVTSAGAPAFAVDTAGGHDSSQYTDAADGTRAIVYWKYASPTGSGDSGSLGELAWTQVSIQGAGNAHNYVGGVPDPVPSYTVWKANVGETYVTHLAYRQVVGGDYAAAKAASPIQVASWKNATKEAQSPASAAEFVEYLNTNQSFVADGWWQDGTTSDLYLKLPGDLDPRTCYVWLCPQESWGSDGYQGLILGGPDLRVAGLEFRVQSNGVRVSSGAKRAIVERCLFACSPLMLNATDSSSYAEDTLIWDNHFAYNRVWSLDGSPQIGWNFVKDFIVLADGTKWGHKIGGWLENTACFARRYVRRTTFRANLVEQVHNGYGCTSNAGDGSLQQNYATTVRGNRFRYVGDNPTEHENLATNWAVYDNVYHDSKTCYSTDFSGGPVVYFRELAYRIGGHGVTLDGLGLGGGGEPWKWGGNTSPRSALYLIHCTYLTYGDDTSVMVDSVSGTPNQYWYIRNCLLGSDRNIIQITTAQAPWDEDYNVLATADASGDCAILVDGVRYDAGGVTGASSLAAYRSATRTQTPLVGPTIGGGAHTNRLGGTDYPFTTTGFTRLVAQFVGNVLAVSPSDADFALAVGAEARGAGVVLGHLNSELGRAPNLGHTP